MIRKQLTLTVEGKPEKYILQVIASHDFFFRVVNG